MYIFKKNLLLFVIVLIFTILSGCSSRYEGETDTSERRIDKSVDKIVIGIPYAQQRAQEWRKNLQLNYINAGFVGKESINSRKGQINYFFYEENVKKNLDASAEVCIDMNKNSIVKFDSQYGTGKELIGSSDVLDTKKWVIDINEAFDIAKNKIGENIINKYSAPKVVLRCTTEFWEFALYASSDATYEDWLVVINPATGKVIRIEDKTQNK